MVKNHHLALSVADAGMGRLMTLCGYKGNWRGRTVEKVDPWSPSSQLCCMCGAQHRRMKNLSVRIMRCDCGNVMRLDRNASVNIYNVVPAGSGERLGLGRATRVEIGDQGNACKRDPVPVAETRMLEFVA